MHFEFFAFGAPTKNRLRTMQIVIPVIVNIVEFVRVRVHFDADDDAIFRRDEVADTRLKFARISVDVEVKQRIRRVIFRVRVADESCQSVVDFASEHDAVIPTFDGHFARINFSLRVIFGDFVTGLKQEQVLVHINRVVRQLEFVFLMSA